MARCCKQRLSYPVLSSSLYFLIKWYMSLVETFGLLMDRAWLWNLQEKPFPSFWKRNAPPILWRSQQYFQWVISSDMKQIYTITPRILNSRILLPHCSKFNLTCFSRYSIVVSNNWYNTIDNLSDVPFTLTYQMSLKHRSFSV